MSLYEILSTNLQAVKQITAGATSTEIRKSFCPDRNDRRVREVVSRIRRENVKPAMQETAPGYYEPSLSKEVVEIEQTPDSFTYKITNSRIRTLDQFIAKYEIDTDRYSIPYFKPKYYEGYCKNNDGELIVEPLCAIQARVNRNHEQCAIIDFVERMQAKAAEWAPTYPCYQRLWQDSGLLWEVSLADHHFGKRAWSPETRGIDYDVDIARTAWEDAVVKLISRVRHLHISQIVFVVGNDLLHIDNREGTTTSGTHVDPDTRFQRTFSIVHDACVWAIDQLLLVAPVKVVVVPGNHDSNSAYAIGHSLKSWYRNCGDVEIDNSPAIHKYMQWGKCLIGWDHGDKGGQRKARDYGAIVPYEAPTEWANTLWREMHVGHLHHEASTQSIGVQVRRVPSLSPPDAWHTENGFVGAIRSSLSFVWSKEEGLIDTPRYNPVDRIIGGL